jgi:hypothetical protein
VNQYILKFVCGLSIFAMPLLAEEPEEFSQGQQMSDEERCAKEILMRHFPEKLVEAALKKFQIPEDQQAAIVKELAEKDGNIVKMVEEKASTMNPNPLRDPQMRQQAVRLFRETMLEQFSGVLKAHGVTDDAKIQQMLDEVQLQKAKQFSECMEKMHPEIKRSKPTAQLDNDNDNEDGNNEEDNG